MAPRIRFNGLALAFELPVQLRYVNGFTAHLGTSRGTAKGSCK